MLLAGNQSHGIQPGETHTYVWRVVEEDEPFDKDSRCLTRVYHSAVNAPRDISSGLIGPILICKSKSLNARNVQVKRLFTNSFWKSNCFCTSILRSAHYSSGQKVDGTIMMELRGAYCFILSLSFLLSIMQYII